MPTIKKLMLNGVAYKFKASPVPLGEGILQENGMETWLENGNYVDFEAPTPPVPKEYNTMTIKWQETSNPADFFLEYADDAEGLTQGDTVFDEFFGYSAVRLNASGVETAEVTQAQSGGAGKLDMSQLGDLSTGDNVMIKFPLMGIKMSKSGRTVTLSITKETGKESEGYQYYAHCTGTLSNPGTPKQAFYLGAYKSYLYPTGNISKSRSGRIPTTQNTQKDDGIFAKRNGSGYNIEGFYQRQYINALYMMKYGNPYAQSVIGRGKVSGSIDLTGNTRNQISATYGTSGTSPTVQMKLFGLEDWWGNVSEWIGGAYTDANKQLCVNLTGWTGDTSGGEGTGTTIQHTSTYYDLYLIAGNNDAMFAPIRTANNTSYDTYYTDYTVVTASRLICAGGSYGHGEWAGVFFLAADYRTSTRDYTIGSRIMYLEGLT